MHSTHVVQKQGKQSQPGEQTVGYVVHREKTHVNFSLTLLAVSLKTFQSNALCGVVEIFSV